METSPSSRRSNASRGATGTTTATIVLVAVLALATGCSATVAGPGSGTAATTTESTPEPDPVPVIDEGAPARYCDAPFAGALGKPMLAVVVETPSGRLTCDQAAAVLFDYYAQRHDPTPELPPLMIGTMTCDQVPEPALPQVVCADEDNVVYSMWPQT